MKKCFSLNMPCANCPFRNDEHSIKLQPGRREQIIEDLLSGKEESFPCHKTVYREDGRNHDENGDYKPVDVSTCAGAAALCRKYGRDMVIVQLAYRLGVIPYEHYDSASDTVLEPGDLVVCPERARI
jgi:hypothetical protein